MKNKNLLIFLPLLTLFLNCSEEEPVVEYITVTETITVNETSTVEVDPFADSTLEGNITEDTTLDASKIWLLKGELL